jgi:uncharacterized protein YbaP (TraB family)
MRFKMPCLKNRAPDCHAPIHTLIHALSLALLLAMLSTGAVAGSDRASDIALFWSLQKNGQQAGYLLGTIHSEDPRVLDFSEVLLDRLRSNEVFAMEMVPDALTLERLGDYMNYPPGQSLATVIGAERLHALESALSAYQVPVALVERMKPWAAMLILSTPPPATGFFMDLSLSLRAAGNGLAVIGLETLEEQLSFLENMPVPMQLALLDQAIAEAEQVGEIHEQMVTAYLGNNLAVLEALSDEQLQVVDQSTREYFIESGIHVRNHRMADALLLLLEQKTVFAAVGALHLSGEEGLINILRQHGFTLNPLEMPLAGTPAAKP